MSSAREDVCVCEVAHLKKISREAGPRISKGGKEGSGMRLPHGKCQRRRGVAWRGVRGRKEQWSVWLARGKDEGILAHPMRSACPLLLAVPRACSFLPIRTDLSRTAGGKGWALGLAPGIRAVYLVRRATTSFTTHSWRDQSCSLPRVRCRCASRMSPAGIWGGGTSVEAPVMCREAGESMWRK